MSIKIYDINVLESQNTSQPYILYSYEPYIDRIDFHSQCIPTKIHSLPVHRFVQTDENGKQTDLFIAIGPELLRVLQALVRSDAAELLEEKEQQIRSLRSFMDDTYVLLNKSERQLNNMLAVNGLPWYTRVIKALRKDYHV
jgi:hypothetical protein